VEHGDRHGNAGNVVYWWGVLK